MSNLSCTIVSGFTTWSPCDIEEKGTSNCNVWSREMLAPGSVQEKYESISLSDRASHPGPEIWGRDVDITP